MSLIEASLFVAKCPSMPTLPFMAQKTTKPMQLRIRVDDEDVETLKTLAGKALSVAAVASGLLHAAIQAVRDNQGRLSFPPTLQVAELDPEREPQQRGRVRR